MASPVGSLGERPAVLSADPTAAPKVAAVLPALVSGASHEYEIVFRGSDPSGERVDTASQRPCDDMEAETAPGDVTVEVDGRRIRVEWAEESFLVVREGKQRLWDRSFPHAGPFSPAFCVRPGWHAILAGGHREGTLVFDLFTGKLRGRANELIVAPDQRWALITPPMSWGRTCYETSRAFRISLDQSEPKRSLDTPPKPASWLCDGNEEDRFGDVPLADMAISPDSKFYAFVNEHVLALYRASDDMKIASTPLRSPYSRIFFSRSGRYLVLGDATSRPQHPDTPLAWYEIVEPDQ